MKVALITFVVLGCLLYVNAKPLPPQFDFNDDIFDFNFPNLNIEEDCKKLGCEASATSCSKKVSTSEDRKTLDEEIKCYGANGNELSSTHNSKENPVPGSLQNGYEYFGSYSSGTQSINVNGNQHHNTNLDNVETFDN